MLNSSLDALPVTTIATYKPRQVAIELVKGCNFFCTMCPVPAGTADHRWTFMTLDTIQYLCAEVARTPSIHTLWYFGFGEPMAHPHFEETLAILNRALLDAPHQPDVIMHTNASLLNGSKAQALLDIPSVTHLYFSFDGLGDKASYEALRGPHFDAVLDNIKAFAAQAKQKRPDLALSTCSIVPAPGDAVTFVDQWPSQEDIHRRYQALFEPLGVTVATRPLHNYAGDIALQNHGHVGLQPKWGCPHLENDYLFFRVSGNVQPCCASFNESLAIGHFNKDDHDFSNLLNSSVINGLRHNLRLDQRADTPVCNTCTISLNELPSQDRMDYWRARDRQIPIMDDEERRHLLLA
jgi:hypothetical protein